jgi:hypothetical protein
MPRVTAVMIAAMLVLAFAAVPAASHPDDITDDLSDEVADDVLDLPPVADLAAEEADASDTIEHITNMTFDTPWPQGSVRASDSDFITVEVHPRDVPRPNQAAPDGVHWYTEDMLAANYRQRVAQQRERVFNVMGTYWHGMQIVDVTDRDDPIRVAAYDCRVAQADVFTFEQTDDDGQTRHYAAYSQDAAAAQSPEGSHCHVMNGTEDTNERGSYLVELTDPFRPADRGFLHMAKGSHQITVHPDGEHVYNNAAVVLTTEPGFIEVYDVSAIHERTPGDWGYEIVDVIELVTGLDSHDMSFSEDGTRAYSAAINHSFIIDTSDPTDNAIVARIFDPAINIHHDAHAIDVGDQTFMLIGDELAGAAANAYCPGGGIHVYDITDDLESTPMKVGAFFIPDVRPAGFGGETGDVLRCPAHVIQVIEEHEILVVAWYNAGLRVLDYSGLADLGGVGPQIGFGNQSITPGIQQVAWSRFEDSDLWSAKVYPGDFANGELFVYGGDVVRSMDVWRVDVDAALGEETEAQEAGRWLDPTSAFWRGVSKQSELEARSAAGQLDHHKEAGPYQVR